MPVDVAMEEPDAWIVREKHDLGPALRRNRNHGALEVSGVMLCFREVAGGQDPEVVPVDMDGMFASVCVEDSNEYALLGRKNERVCAVSQRVVQLRRRVVDEASLMMRRGRVQGTRLQVAEQQRSVSPRRGPRRGSVSHIVE